MMGVSSNLHGLCIIIIPCCVLFSCYIQAEAQTGFVSIDCGGTGRYRDENSITWTPDTDSQAISSEGNATAVEPPLYAKTYPTPLSTIRYFPGNHSKYCYVFGSDDGVKKDSAYLIRASFWAGSALPYGTRVVNQVRFDLLIYANLWDEIAISFPQVEREDFREMQIIAVRDSIDVCLVGSSSGLDIPFISSLVLRPLDPEMISVGHMMNVTGKRPLMTVERFNYGAPSSQTYVRYQGNQMGDRFDRIWFPNTMQPILSTTSLVDTNTIEGIPIIVLQTALEDPELIDIPLDLGYGGYYFLYLYFAEISQEVSGAGERVFDIRAWA